MKVAAIAGFAWEPKGTVRARAFPMMASLVRRGHQALLLTIPYDNPRLAGTREVRDGVEIAGTPLARGPWRLLDAPCRAVEELKRWQPDVVHVFKPKGYAGAVADRLLRQTDLPVCLDMDDWEGWGGWNEVKRYPWLVKAYIDRQERFLSRQAHSVTVASRVLEQRALDCGQRAEQLFYVPNGVTAPLYERLGGGEERRAAARQKLQLAPNSVVILYTGHFEAGDDVLFFCRVVKSALEGGAVLLLVGDGVEMTKVKSFFDASPGLAIRYMGRLPNDEYLESVLAADIACFPYPDTPVYRAKCSARILDYMTAGRAVVTTNVGQNPEYIVHGESGVLCPPGDERAFSAALLDLVANSRRRDALGVAARKRIADQFLWHHEAVRSCEAAYEMAMLRCCAAGRHNAQQSRHA